MRAIIDRVAQRYNIPSSSIMGHCRITGLTRIRQEAMYLAMSETDLSMAKIAQAFGKDHTSIIHGVAVHCRINGIELPRSAAWKKFDRLEGKALKTTSKSTRAVMNKRTSARELIVMNPKPVTPGRWCPLLAALQARGHAYAD